MTDVAPSQLTVFPYQPFDLSREPDEWDDVSARARLFASAFPQLSQDPSALWAISTAPIPPITSARDAYALAGAQRTDLNLTTVRGWSLSNQRGWWANLSDGERARYASMGYTPPEEADDGWGAGLLRRVAPGFDRVWEAGYTVGSGIVGSVLRGLNEFGELPFEAYNEVRTGEPWQQIAGGAVALGAIALMAKGAGGNAGFLGRVVANPALQGAGGVTFQKALSDIGGAGLSLSFSTGVAAAWATKAVTDTLMGNPETWTEPIGWLDHRNASERNFLASNVDRARRIIGEDPDQVLEFAKLIALESDDPVRDVLTEFAGETYPANQTLEARRNVMLGALERVVSSQHVPGTQAFLDAYAAGEAMIRDERFAEATDALIDGKISIGRDVVRLFGLPLGAVGVDLSWEEGAGRILSGAVDATSWLLVDPIIGAAKFGHAQRVMRKGLMVDAANLDTRIDALTKKPGIRSAFGFISNHLNEADTDPTALARLLRSMPDTAELVPSLTAWRNQYEIGSKLRQAGPTTGRFWDAERMSLFFKDQSALTQLIAGKAGSYRYGFVQMPYLHPQFGEKAALMKQTFWDAIERLDDIHLGIGTRTMDSDVYRRAEEMGILDRDPNRLWMSPDVEVANATSPTSLPRLVRIFGAPATLAKTLLTRTPSAGYISLSDAAANTESFVKEMRAFTELMRVVGAPSRVRQQWMDLLVRAPDIGARHQAVKYLYESLFNVAALRQTPDGAALADRFVEHTDQVFSLGKNYATLVGETSDMIAIPSLQELRKAVVSDHLFRRVLAATDNNMLDSFMNKIWKPAVLLRIGFVTRAVGDELLGWIAREGVSGFTQARMAKFLGSGEALPGHVRWVESTANWFLKHRDFAVKGFWQPWRSIDDVAGYGDDAVTLSFLRRYGDWFTRFTDQGTWLRNVNLPGQLETWAKRPGTLRSMLFNGIDDDLKHAVQMAMGDPKLRSALMRETTATRMVGSTRAMQRLNPYTSSPDHLAVAEDPSYQLIAAARGHQTRLADTNNLNYITSVARDQRQFLGTDDPIREMFVDIELTSPTPQIRESMVHLFQDMDPDVDLKGFSAAYAQRMDGLSETLGRLSADQRAWLTAVLLDSDGTPDALRQIARRFDDDAPQRMVYDTLAGALAYGSPRDEMIDFLIRTDVIPQDLRLLDGAFRIPDRATQILTRHYLAALVNRSGRQVPLRFAQRSFTSKRDQLVDAWLRFYGRSPEWRQRVSRLSLFSTTSKTGRKLAYVPRAGETVGYVPLVPASIVDDYFRYGAGGLAPVSDSFFLNLSPQDLGRPVMVGNQLHYPMIGYTTLDPVHAQEISRRIWSVNTSWQPSTRKGRLTAEVILPSSVGSGRGVDVPWFTPRQRDPNAETIGEGVFRITDQDAAVIHVPDPDTGMVLVPKPGTTEWEARSGASVEEALREHAEATVDAYMERYYTSGPDLRDPDATTAPPLKTEPVDPEMQTVAQDETEALPVRSYVDPSSGRYDMVISAEGVRQDHAAGMPFLRGLTQVEVTDPVVRSYPDLITPEGAGFQWSTTGDTLPSQVSALLPGTEAIENPHAYLESLALAFTETADPTWRPQAVKEIKRIVKYSDSWDDARWREFEQSIPRSQVDEVRAFATKPRDMDEAAMAEMRWNIVQVTGNILAQEAARRVTSRLTGPRFRQWVDEQWASAPATWETNGTITQRDPVAQALQTVRNQLALTQRQGEVWVKASDIVRDRRGLDDLIAEFFQSFKVGGKTVSVVLLADDVAATRRILTEMADVEIPQLLRVHAPDSHRLAYTDLIHRPWKPESFRRRDWGGDDSASLLGQASIQAEDVPVLDPSQPYFVEQTTQAPMVMVSDRSGWWLEQRRRLAEMWGMSLDEWFARQGNLAWFMSNHGTTPSKWLEANASLPEQWMKVYHHEIGHHLLNHLGTTPYSSGQERAVNAYAAHVLKMPVGQNTWTVAGTHAHPESVMLGAWLDTHRDKEHILDFFAQDPEAYGRFLNNWATANAYDPLDRLSGQSMDFDSHLASAGYRSPEPPAVDEGPRRLMFETVGPFTAEFTMPEMREASMGAIAPVFNTMPRDLFPGVAIERAPLVTEAVPRGWDKVVAHGFGKVIGPMIDNLVREPMTFHHFGRALRDARAAQQWLLDPYYFAKVARSDLLVDIAHTGSFDQEGWGVEEHRLADLLAQDMAIDPKTRLPVVGDPNVDKALDISLGQAWTVNDITPTPWLAANKERVLTILGDDPTTRPLRNMVESLVVDTRLDDALRMRPRGRMYDLVESRVTGIDQAFLRKEWRRIRPALSRLTDGGVHFSDRFRFADIMNAARNPDRTLAIIDSEIAAAKASGQLGMSRGVQAAVKTAEAELEGLQILRSTFARVRALDEETGIEQLLSWWTTERGRRLKGRRIWDLSETEAEELARRVNFGSPFGQFSVGDLEVLEGAWRNQEAVQKHMLDLAQTRAINDTIPYVDRDNVRTQFSDSVRNLIPFWAAEDQFMRRWLRIAAHTPEFVRKAQLLYMGLKQVGTVQTDEFGNDYYVYPGSTALVEALGKLPFIDTYAPLATGLTGQVRYSLPGLDRFGVPQVSPLVAVPLNSIANVVPELKPFAQTIAGDRTTALSIYEQIVPTQVLRFMTAFAGDPRHSERMAGSFMQAAAVLEANGHGLPDSADPSQVEQYLDRLASHTRTIYIAKALLGFFAPASPSDQVIGSETPGATGDWWSLQALTGMNAPDVMLNDEWQELVGNLGVEDGTFAFLQLYPDSTPDDLFNRNIAYRVSRSETLAKAPIASNDETWGFYVDNEEWIKDNPMAGAWLMPPASRKKVSNTESQRVRMQQMATGLRSRVGTEDFVRNLKYAVAADMYFSTKRWFEDQYAMLTDQDAVRALKAREATWTASFSAANPIFAQELQSGEGRTRRQEVLAAMRSASQDPATPQARHRTDLFRLVNAYDSFRGLMSELNQSSTRRSQEMKQAARASFKDWGDRLSVTNPDVARFWQTIIVPETDLD